MNPLVYLGETLQVSDALNLINSTLDQTLPAIIIEGEVSSFKISKDKWVFFDIKDDQANLNCFMPIFQLNVPVEDGMRIRVLAQPKITNWGRFSLTVKQVEPVGEGSIKKAYQLLKQKLEKEGLFDESRRRALPEFPQNIGVITSSGAAGWEDFKRVINDRWGGMNVQYADVQVQGMSSPGQIIKAVKYFNEQSKPVELIAIVRGGGSIDDLAGFNDEFLIRAVSSSRIPIVVGVGHENDETLASLTADINAATPTHAATIITPNKEDVIDNIDSLLKYALSKIDNLILSLNNLVNGLYSSAANYWSNFNNSTNSLIDNLKAYDPEAVLNRGYALVKSADGSKIAVESDIVVTTKLNLINAKVTSVKRR